MPESAANNHSDSGLIYFKKVSLAFLIFAIFIGITILTLKFTYDFLRGQNSNAFMNTSDSLTIAVNKELESYTDILFDIQGLFAASTSVEKDEFKTYFDIVGLKEKFPGIHSLNYVAVVGKEDLNEFVKETRQINKIPNFTIHSEREKEVYYIVTFSEPEEDSINLLGFDLGDDPYIKAALNKSIETGQVTITPKLPLRSSTAFGFYAIAPIYKNDIDLESFESRRKNIVGFAVLELNPKEMFDYIIPKLNPNIVYTIYDVTNESSFSINNILYFSKDVFDGTVYLRDYESKNDIAAFGREWVLEVVSINKNFWNYDRVLLLGVLVAGISISLLLFFIVFSLSTSNARALKMALKLTNNIQDSEKMFRLLAENARDLIFRYRIFPTPKFDYVSSVSKEMIGYSPDEFYKDAELFNKIVYVEDQPLLSRLTEISGDFKKSIVLRWVKRDGTLIWVELDITPSYSVYKKIIAYQVIARDITERKKTEDTLAARTAELEVLNKVLVGREMKMLQLKEDIKKLKKEKD